MCAICEPLFVAFAAAAGACIAVNAGMNDVVILTALPAVAAEFFVTVGVVVVSESPVFPVIITFSVAFVLVTFFTYAANELSASFTLAVTIGA